MIDNGLLLMRSPSEDWGSPDIMQLYIDKCMTIFITQEGTTHCLGKIDLHFSYTLHSYAAQNNILM